MRKRERERGSSVLVKRRVTRIYSSSAQFFADRLSDVRKVTACSKYRDDDDERTMKTTN